MIQRIQSIYLLSISIIITIILFTDSRISSGEGMLNGIQSDYSLTVLKTIVNNGATNENWNPAIVTGLMLCGIISLTTIFLFRNLRIQHTLVNINFIIVCFSLMIILYTHLNVVRPFKQIQVEFSYQLAHYLLILVLNLLALRGIRKDIELLASTERLR